jgi:non-specific serine/threonine protein kinase
MGAEPGETTTALFRRLREETRAGARPRAPERGGAAAAPPRNLFDPVPRALPLPLTQLVGREEAVREVTERLAPEPAGGGCRLVTLTGAGGIGKTRLALQVAHELADQFVDGVWFVELAALADGALVSQTVAAALRIQEQSDRPALEALGEALQDRQLLLTLDSCEHLVGACVAVAHALLSRCAAVRILATSRQPLGVTGEVAWRVPSLEIPTSAALPPEAKDAISYFLSYDAVRLFIARAQQAAPRFRLVPQDAETIAQICRRLDGIPLAIELAAARVRAMTVGQIAARLDDRFRLLTGGSRTALPRQQTLRGAMDWSYDLLSEAERVLMRRLSVFAGGWTLEAAEAVCGDCGVRRAGCGLPGADRPIRKPHSTIHDHEVLNLLTGLVDRSLVVYEETGAGGRYRFLETMRQYSSERLEEAGETDAARGRHLAFFLRLAAAAEPHLTGAEQGEWLDRLETELDNVRAALDWAGSSDAGHRSIGERPDAPELATLPAGEAGLRLAGALWRFWAVRGYLTEGRERLARGLANPVGGTPGRAKALTTAGSLAYRQGDHQTARSLFEEGLAIQQQLGDRPGIAASLHSLGLVAYHRGEIEAARSLYEEGLTIRRESGDRWGIAASFHSLGNIAYDQGDHEAARSLYEEGLAIRRELGDHSGVAASLNDLGMVALARADYQTACSLFEESLSIKRDMGNRLGVASSLYNMAIATYAQGDLVTARSRCVEGLAIQAELGDRLGIATSLEALAMLACGRPGRPGGGQTAGDPEGSRTVERADTAAAGRAARLFGSSEALREAIGAPLRPNEHAAYRRQVRRLRAMLGEPAFAAAWAEGRAMHLGQAVATALGES